MITLGKAWSYFPRYRAPFQVLVNSSFLLLWGFFSKWRELIELTKPFNLWFQNCDLRRLNLWIERKIIYLQSLNREQIEKKKRYRTRKNALCLVVNCYQPLLSKKKIKDVLIFRNKCMCYVGLQTVHYYHIAGPPACFYDRRKRSRLCSNFSREAF